MNLPNQRRLFRAFAASVLIGVVPNAVSLAMGDRKAAAAAMGALSFIPGGLGSTEATMEVIPAVTGADLPAALSATLACGLAILWFAVGIGLGCLGALEATPKRRNPGPSGA